MINSRRARGGGFTGGFRRAELDAAVGPGTTVYNISTYSASDVWYVLDVVFKRHVDAAEHVNKQDHPKMKIAYIQR